MVTAVEEATPVVLIVNVPVVDPPGTVTVEGTVAAALFEVSGIAKPAGGAAELNVTVPVEVPPPTTDEGETVSACSVGGLMVKTAVVVRDP